MAKTYPHIIVLPPSEFERQTAYTFRQQIRCHREACESEARALCCLIACILAYWLVIWLTICILG